jgi:type IV/VI secretion system ImpK/VasF family protein
MTLIELCEPLFLKICELNRMARLGQSQEYLEVRTEIKELLDDIQRKASSEVKLAAQAEKLKQPLTFFADSMIASSKLKFAGEWHQNRLAKERYNVLNGDSEFFRLLQETNNDPSDEASERLAVFHICLGLGFVGALVVQPAKLKDYMNQIFPRIKHLMDLDPHARLCPDAYKFTDTRPLDRLPTHQVMLVLVLFIFLSLSSLVLYIGMYMTATQEMDGAIKTIEKLEKHP